MLEELEGWLAAEAWSPGTWVTHTNIESWGGDDSGASDGCWALQDLAVVPHSALSTIREIPEWFKMWLEEMCGLYPAGVANIMGGGSGVCLGCFYLKHPMRYRHL